MDNALNLNIFNCLVLAGIIQGVVFTIVVAASKKYRSFGTLILSAFILSFSLDNFQFFLEDAGIISEVELMSKFFLPFQFLSGPLFLLYGLSLLNPNRSFQKTDVWLFIPFGVALIVSSLFKIVAANSDQSAFFSIMQASFEIASIAIDFSVLSYLMIKVYSSSDMQNLRLKWFKYVLVSLFSLTLLWIYVTYQDLYNDTDYWYYIYIGMSVVIYWMGHIGIYHFGTEVQRRKSENKQQKPNTHIATLEHLVVGERRFLDPQITLESVAAELGLSKTHLSRIINSELQMSFPDYLNKLRVEEAKSYLQNPAFSNYTLIAIGLEAGFSSKSAFNSSFKKITSLTPSEYRKKFLE